MSENDFILRERIIEKLRTVQDPELPINLYDLGLIYELVVNADRVSITMTLTTPSCPVAESMPGQVDAAVRQVEGVGEVEVELVFEPPWTSERMSDDARMTLDMLGIDWTDPGRSTGGTSLTVGRKPRT